MTSENKLPVIIFALLVALIAMPLIWNQIRDARRPQLIGARIVMATGDDPVFRTGPRHVGPHDTVTIALALELQQPGGTGWLAPAESLHIDGEPVDNTATDQWPESDRQLRVFWFTVESSNIGGTVAVENAPSILRYRTYLASEVGQGLVGKTTPEAHNVDHLGLPPDTFPVTAGTIRIYAKAEIIDPETSEVRAVQSIATRGPDEILDPGFPAIHRSLEVPEGIHPGVGELFNLPGWEMPAGEFDKADDAAEAAFGLTFSELVSRRILTSSRTFAAVASTGSPVVGPEPPPDPASVSLADGAVLRGRRSVAWAELEPGDWLVDGDHVAVLVADDGNGLLDAGDTVLHCWRRPPAVTTLGAALSEQPTQLNLVLHGR